ncbi:hypothetical protein IRJ41_020799 [Triplophysa rosa]|uniref:Uncharacterized protein n=1 Tax=Triplophysa rosa TaxID=992332 RepID=A0A9W7T920_TRIRA|nr:hypothetical protein IRJ41_020799 [Triplophysa rosa]
MGGHLQTFKRFTNFIHPVTIRLRRPPGKPRSTLCEVMHRIFGEDNAVISGVESSQDPAAMKLKILSQSYNEDAGDLLDPASLNTGSPYATTSTSSQVCPAVDDSPAEDPLPDDL